MPLSNSFLKQEVFYNVHKRNFLFGVLFHNTGFEKQKSIWCILHQLFLIKKWQINPERLSVWSLHAVIQALVVLVGVGDCFV